jgi:hypothetical protein
MNCIRSGIIHPVLYGLAPKVGFKSALPPDSRRMGSSPSPFHAPRALHPRTPSVWGVLGGGHPPSASPERTAALLVSDLKYVRCLCRRIDLLKFLDGSANRILSLLL